MHAMFRFVAISCAILAGPGLAVGAGTEKTTDATDVAAPIKPVKPSKIILVGDSTVAVQSGWGGGFCAEHVTAFTACVNLARGGRSTSSYIAEGSWANALNEARVPGYARTWVLIQFGHNDQPGKPGRSTDLATEYPRYLERYVRETRDAGAVPVLVTPLTRRMFARGTLKNDLVPWADAMKKVAQDLGAPLIDLNALSSAAVQSMGAAAANKLAQRPPTAAVAEGRSISAATEVDDRPPPPAVAPGMAQPKLAFDYTHLGRAGSDYFAAMVTAELARQITEMRPLLIQ